MNILMKIMSNFEPNLIDLKLVYNHDGSATLDTKNTVYEIYDIKLVKIIADIFKSRYVNKYQFSMFIKDLNFPTCDNTWTITFKPTNTRFNTTFLCGHIEQDGKQINCTNL